jgi:membrane protein DedA with SNARE-associated domain
MEQHDTRYIFYTFWNPGLAAFSSTAAGIVQMSALRFFTRAVLAVLVWNTFWGVLVYSLGVNALQLLDVRLVLFIIGMWILFECGLLLRRRFARAT